MRCPHCDEPAVPFSVPRALRAYAPDERDDHEAAALCSHCYRTRALAGDEADDAPSPEDVDFAAVDPSFPPGEAGVALALALGKLDSLALNRPAVTELLAHAETEGADVFLALDRLDREGAHADLDRRLAQLEDLI